MAIPVWVRCSTVGDGIAETVRRDIAPLMQRFECQLFKVSRLGYDPYEQAFGFAGDLTPDDTVACTTEEEALAAGAGWDGICLSYKLLPLTSYLYVYVWRLEERTCVALQIDAGVLYFRSDEDSDGDWLERFLAAAAASLHVDACVYGTGYEVVYEPIDPASVLRLIRDGTVMYRPYPSFHAVALAMISEAEVHQMLNTPGRPSPTRYTLTTSGYHVFSNLK